MDENTDHVSSCFPHSPSLPEQNPDIYHTAYIELDGAETGSNVPPMVTVRVQRRSILGVFEQQQLQAFSLCEFIEQDMVKVDRMLCALSELMNISFQAHQIMLLLPDGNIFVNLGNYPLLETSYIASFQDFISDNIIIIGALPSKRKMIHLEMSRDITQHLTDGPPRLLQKAKECEDDGGVIRKQTSIKNFQKIGYIVKKILSIKNRRQLRQEFSFKNDRNLTRKSVDDYFYQIKQGCKYGFDFNANSKRNMKFLREFVRERDEQFKKESGSGGKMKMRTKETRNGGKQEELFK